MEDKSCSTCKYALFDEETNTLNCTNIKSKLCKYAWMQIFRGKWVKQMAEWIPTSERLPEDKTSFIATITTKALTRVTMATRIGDEYFEGGERLYFGAIKAWMPLPEPYKGSEQ